MMRKIRFDRSNGLKVDQERKIDSLINYKYLLEGIMGWCAKNMFPHVVIGKIFVAKKYLETPSVFKLQKWFLHQNGVEFNQKSKSELIKL